MAFNVLLHYPRSRYNANPHSPMEAKYIHFPSNSVSTSASVGLALILRQCNGIFDSISKHVPCLVSKRFTMRQRIPRNRLESLIDIHTILGRNFKIRNRGLTLFAPCQSPLLCNLIKINSSSTMTLNTILLLSSTSILLPTQMNAKFCGSRGFACIKNSSFQLFKFSNDFWLLTS